MEEFKKKSASEQDRDIVYSNVIKAGQRIYYIDVKKNRKEEMFVAITESKKVYSGEGEDAHVNFEKHKIFLYREDFGKFLDSLNEAVQFVTTQQGEAVQRLYEPTDTDNESIENKSDSTSGTTDLGGEIKINLDF